MAQEPRPRALDNQEVSVHAKFKELLHQYKLEVFHNEHDKRSVEEITTECLHVTEDVLKQKTHYQFHGVPDATRAEWVNLINNYVREAILPPVIEKLVERQMRLELRFEAMLQMQHDMLEVLSQDQGAKEAAKR
jgi:hypothetical protein